ncbi:TPA: hypothetical protein ACUNF5_003893 [Burkholderia orbicola]|uniref:hypothetical protein n=1 Tax=Burkholderia cenocepacia TaxID=95486 RepID=UPI000F5AE77B|nr:hypothetical protein [Burkholderia cenocepacia]MBR8155452.1 hypothetical protein [Burkholderia cenocepacia]
MVEQRNYVMTGNEAGMSRASMTLTLVAEPEPLGARLQSKPAKEMSELERFVREWIPVTQEISLGELLENFDYCERVETLPIATSTLSMGERVFLEESGLDAVSSWELWHRIFGTHASRTRRASRTELTLAVDALVGSSDRPQPSSCLADASNGASLLLDQAHALVTEYVRSLVRESMGRRRSFVKQHTAALKRLCRILILPIAETGSAAAIAKRMNPLGAPPRFA